MRKDSPRKQRLHLACRAALDPFLIVLTLENGVDVDAGSVDLVWLKFAEIDELLYLRDHVVGGSGHHGIKIASRLAVNEVAPAITLPSLDERKIPAYAPL